MTNEQIDHLVAANMERVYARRWAALKVITTAIRSQGWTLVQFAAALDSGAVQLQRKQSKKKDVKK